MKHPETVEGDPTQASAACMARMVRDRELSPVDLLEAHLERIERLDPKLGALVHVDAAGARGSAEAAAARARAGAPAGPLDGVPVTIKSSIAVAGFPWECGSILRQGLCAERDAPLVARLRAAGAVVLGGTNAPELLMAWETDNRLRGRANNPWDLERTAGGSSGGESAAIAAGLSAGGIGSDGGGSIRVPAHFTGIYGLKPTPGRVPATGHFPESAGPFAALGVVGPMARTAEDLRLLFEVVAGPDDGDAHAAPVPLRPVEAGALRGLRVGVFEDDGRTPVTPETREAVRRAADALEARGFRVEAYRPEGLEEIRQLWWNLFGRAGGVLLGPMLQGRDADLSPTLQQYRGYVRDSPPLTMDDLMETLLGRDVARARLFAAMQRYPVLLCPVAAVPAFRHGEREWTVEGQRVEYLDAWSYTEWFNLTGNPALAVPVPRPAGLPVGVQLVGRCWEEETLLAVAAELEAELGPPARPPALPQG